MNMLSLPKEAAAAVSTFLSLPRHPIRKGLMRLSQLVYNIPSSIHPHQRRNDILACPLMWTLNGTGGLVDVDRIMLGRFYGDADSVFEFGIGESTRIANAVGVPRYAGTDSDPHYVEQTRNEVADHFRFYFADIGPTVQWGFPKKELTKAVWNYQIAPLLSEPFPFDVYLIDGRYRFPCMITSFLHASARGANSAHTIVLVHDCFRDFYHHADHLLDLIQKSESGLLCAYRRKPTTSDEDLLRLWDREKLDVV